VHACPHDNVALNARVAGLELLGTRRQSGIGRLFQRADLAALAIVFTFGALVNAFAMTSPAYALERRLAGLLHVHSEGPVLAAVFLSALVLVPALLLFGAHGLARLVAGSALSARRAVTQFAFALVPFGFGVWLAHYGFHLLTGVLTIVPVTQSAAIDLFGAAMLGEPLWGWTGMAPGQVYPIQLGFLILGACGSLALVQAGSSRDTPQRSGAATVPWYAIVLALFVAAVWILHQPMDMRGLGGVG
jgi:hypothetical protein